MATITFENVRDVKPYFSLDLRVLTGLNAVPNDSYAHKAATIKAILEGAELIPMFMDDDRYWGNGGDFPQGPQGPIDLNVVQAPPVVAIPAPPHEVRIRLHSTLETLTKWGRVNDFCFGTISQIAFADANHQPDQQPYRTVHIEMDAWYFENYPVGYCTGMLCHEFAVHHMGDYVLKSRADDSLIVEGRYKEGGAMEGMPYGVHAPRVTPSTAKQADHAFAATRGAPRNNVYMETVADVALSMLRKIDAGPVPGEVTLADRDVTDLFTCYLMDVASIQCTNDHRARGIVSPWEVANCYNAHRLQLLHLLGEPDPSAQRLQNLVPGPTNTLRVVKDFAYLLSSVAWGFGITWSKE
jgi:hypothetical protein